MLCGLFLLVVFAAVSHARVTTVSELVVSKYYGLWYQVLADKTVDTTIEKDGLCDTAFYGDNGDGTISVHNYETKLTPDGKPQTVDGYAFQTDPENHPGDLKVKFNGGAGAPFPVPYLVVELGPVNSDGLYDYSIVTSTLKEYLFVLVRDVATYHEKYEETIKASVAKMGFTGRTAPTETYQKPDCVYESTSRLSYMKAVRSNTTTTP